MGEQDNINKDPRDVSCKLTGSNMKMAVFWDIAPCSLVEVDRRFKGRYCLHQQGDESFIALMMETVRTSETSVYFNETARRYISFNLILLVSLYQEKQIRKDEPW
jgi:hypothetical protein